ncbi:helix-turn-helix domain-containing protein [Rhizobium binae]|uniref:AraC family transcriptional activator of pobA n=1 Tax=Rhizobium binae TaxID=1138190 RepID=A0ABV2MI72_9HYPH|nr:helix-turn-helix domain-containing protein [Rhizobium binae]NKL48573.1 helix-turn-helix domain-containing protein [Rhizobium leguminosarum bv. viciae]MBX4927862.1 helix-turn-helix domain-containing protein [Rhizobium binae]MBX4938478.1 helix-turn-helix domain-containing protein [Rhizobium binae]MBX4944985.1 helix-turn-helix domain-containing protein [Rhizobium binae]MBX4952193.1 helix-turn-helix domain-containing protein [Rhizobium binae]
MSRHIPTYELYGENVGRSPEFWLHCETIRSRSSLHQWEIRLHRHESFFQILYIEAGSGDAIFGARSHAIRPPAVITVPPAFNHGFRFSRDIDGLVITILQSHLSHPPGERSHLGEWLATPHLTALDPDDAEAAHVMQTLRRLGDEFENRRSGRNEVLAAYVALVLRLTARISHEGNSQELASNENERRMDMLGELIQQHFRSHKPTSFYAGELGVSPTHLTRIVRSMTGSTPHELIAAKLVEEAKRQLVFTLGSVQEIGFRLGFSDPAYFSRFFLKYAGETPRVWRMTEKARLDRG